MSVEQEHLEALIPYMRNRLIENRKHTIFFVVDDVYDKSVLEEIRRIHNGQSSCTRKTNISH